MFGSSLDAYTLYNISTNIDSYINVHNSVISNYTENNAHIIDKSILDIIKDLRIINYISLITIIFLMSQIILKFHLNKNINNIYI